MKRIILSIFTVMILLQSLVAANRSAIKPYSPDLGRIRLISCDKTPVKNQVIATIPTKYGAIIIPTDKLDLTRYNRVKIKITPIDGKFQPVFFAAALRGNKKYSFARFAGRQFIKQADKPFELIFNIEPLPRAKVDFLRIYFNRAGKIDKSVKFKLDSVEFFHSAVVGVAIIGATMMSKVPVEKYPRKLAKTLIFPRIQIKYSLFMNYYPAYKRDLWIERPLLFNRELAADTKEFKKEGNLASFNQHADIVASYADGFSILATGKTYLKRTLEAMRYADKLGRKNFLMLEVSPDLVTRQGKMIAGDDYGFILDIVEAAMKSPSALRINDKLVISSYSADRIAPEQWVPIIKKLREKTDNKLLFIIEIRSKFYKANGAYIKNGGKVSTATIAMMKKFIRSYLDVADGMLFAGCNHLTARSNKISNYEFGDGFYKDILIPTIISVLNEPKYRSKYLGLSAAKGYFYVRRAASGQNEGGTLTLRQSLSTTLGVEPDFIIMPEWNEVNENTHIEPTVYDSFTSKRIINHYRQAPPIADDNLTLPNLIISYRSELVYGENLSIELLNLPDLNYPDATTKVELCLKNCDGKVIKRFAPLTLSNRQVVAEYLKVPIETFNNERLLIPELSISINGKMQLIKGLSCIMLKMPPNMNKKYVKQPIRDLCTTKQITLQWKNQADGVEVQGVVETESPLNTVELLENNIPIAAIDVIKEYRCAANELLLRFCWNSFSNKKQAVNCVIKPLTGTVDTIKHEYIMMSDSKKTKTEKLNSAIHKRLRFGTSIKDLLFKASKDAALEVMVGDEIIHIATADIIKYGVYRKVFTSGRSIAIELVKRLPEVPYPINKKRVEFNLTAKNILPNAIYTVRAITTSGKMFRSQPYYPEKLSGKTITMNVWSYAKQAVIALKIPQEYGQDIAYDFSPGAGDILPAIPAFRFLYGKLGGLDLWNRNFNSQTGAYSAPAWKTESSRSVLEFDGIGNYLMFPAYLLSEQSFTVSCSVMPQSETKQALLQTFYSSNTPCFEVVLADGALSGYLSNRHGKRFKFTTKTRLTTGKWNKISIGYAMQHIIIKINDNPVEQFSCNGLLQGQPILVFGGTFPKKGISRFKGLLRTFSVANYMTIQ